MRIILFFRPELHRFEHRIREEIQTNTENGAYDQSELLKETLEALTCLKFTDMFQQMILSYRPDMLKFKKKSLSTGARTARPVISERTSAESVLPASGKRNNPYYTE